MRISDWSSDVCSSDVTWQWHSMRSIRKSRTSIGCSAKRPPPKLSDPTRSVLRQAVVGIVHVDPVGFGTFPDIGNDIGPAFVRQAGKDDSREQIGRASCRDRVCQYV